MEEGVKLSHAVEGYALGGFLRLKGGMLKLKTDGIELSRMFDSIQIDFLDLDYIRPTKILGFMPWGLEFHKKDGEIIRVYFSNIVTAAANRKKWLAELEKYVKA